MNAWVIAAVIVAGVVVLAGGGAVLSRRKLSPRDVAEAIPAAGAIFATFGVIYGVILGQVVVAAWESYQSAEDAISEEADSLVSITRLAGGLPEDQRLQIRQAAIDYGMAVVNDEWPIIQMGGGSSPKASAALGVLYRVVAAVPGVSANADAIAGAALSELNALDDARGDRVVASRTSMPALMWVALIAGGLLTVAFTYVLAVENGALHLAMVASLASLVALLLVLVLGLSQPFRSPIAIGPEQFGYRMTLLEREIAE